MPVGYAVSALQQMKGPRGAATGAIIYLFKKIWHLLNLSVEEIDEALIFYNKALLFDEDNEQLQKKISSYESQ